MGRKVAHRVLWVRHGVEWAKCEREFVDNEVVGIILSLHDTAKPPLILSTVRWLIGRQMFTLEDLLDIIQYFSVNTIFDKEIDSLFERED
jgi:hypothetical protein